MNSGDCQIEAIRIHQGIKVFYSEIYLNGAGVI